MSQFFEELMEQNRQLTEGVAPRRAPAKKTSVTESKKIPVKKLKVESFKILEDAENFDELDAQFAVDPEESGEDEVVLVIDPELPSDEEAPEDAAQDMIGDSVYKCSVCGSNYVCDCNAEKNESIEVDENGEPTECPICGDDAEQILIGEIAPAEDAGEEVTETDPVDADGSADDSEDDSEVVEEGIFSKKSKEPHTIRGYEKGDPSYSAAVAKELQSKFGGQVKTLSGTESGKEVAWVDTDGKYKAATKYINKKYPSGSFSFDEYKHIKESFNKDTEEDDVEEGIIGDIVGKVFGKNESIDNDVLDNEPACEDEGCLVLDTDDADRDTPAVVANAEVVNVDLSLDEARLESMMNQMIKENYKRNPSFKVTKLTAQGPRLKIEYIIREGKKSSKGTMIAEGFSFEARRLSLKAKDKGAFTESFTKKPAFIIECVRIRNKIIPTSVKYDFTKKANESLYRVKGSVGK